MSTALARQSKVRTPCALHAAVAMITAIAGIYCCHCHSRTPQTTTHFHSNPPLAMSTAITATAAAADAYSLYLYIYNYHHCRAPISTTQQPLQPLTTASPSRAPAPKLPISWPAHDQDCDQRHAHNHCHDHERNQSPRLSSSTLLVMLSHITSNIIVQMLPLQPQPLSAPPEETLPGRVWCQNNSTLHSHIVHREAPATDMTARLLLLWSQRGTSEDAALVWQCGAAVAGVRGLFGTESLNAAHLTVSSAPPGACLT